MIFEPGTAAPDSSVICPLICEFVDCACTGRQANESPASSNVVPRIRVRKKILRAQIISSRKLYSAAQRWRRSRAISPVCDHTLCRLQVVPEDERAFVRGRDHVERTVAV